MKKRMTIVLAVLVTLVLCGCGNAAPKERSLYTQGLDVANLVVQAAQSDAYLDQLSGNASLQEILEDAAQGDYSTPKAVYELRFSSLPEVSDTLPGSSPAGHGRGDCRQFRPDSGHFRAPGHCGFPLRPFI